MGQGGEIVDKIFAEIVTRSEVRSGMLEIAVSDDCLTKTPDRYAVGRGKYEPFVLLRFEDEPAYGLTAEQAANLGEALLEEAEAVRATRYPMRQ
jgi:hypothetical protein